MSSTRPPTFWAHWPERVAVVDLFDSLFIQENKQFNHAPVDLFARFHVLSYPASFISLSSCCNQNVGKNGNIKEKGHSPIGRVSIWNGCWINHFRLFLSLWCCFFLCVSFSGGRPFHSGQDRSKELFSSREKPSVAFTAHTDPSKVFLSLSRCLFAPILFRSFSILNVEQSTLHSVRNGESIISLPSL